MNVIYIGGKFKIVDDNGRILEELGGFIDPVSPQIIIEEIENERKKDAQHNSKS